jgi:hypothetical protein
MNKAGITFSAVLFSFFIALSSSAFADKGGHHDASEKAGEHGKYEEGSGSSAVHSSTEKAEEYKKGHEEAEEEGSFSYKRHRKEMKAKEKSMQEGMHAPEEAAGKMMEEGSGKK